jgi:hypothetical protein
MKNFKELFDVLTRYTTPDYEEVYVDERYVNVPYLKVEDLFTETLDLAKTLSKEEATKLIVHLIKSTEANIKCRYTILKDYRLSYATESAKAAESYFKHADQLLKTDFSSLVTTDPSKILAAINRTKAVVSQFMITPRTIVVYDRKPDYVPDQIQTTVSPSKIVDFDPLNHSETGKEVWAKRVSEFSAGAELPTVEVFNTYIKNHRMVKEYIKNEPKSKNMYKHKGFDKTYNYVRETKQTKKVALGFLIVVVIGILYFVFFA